MNQPEVKIVNAEVLFRAVHHRALVLAGLAAVDCLTLRSPSSLKGAEKLINKLELQLELQREEYRNGKRHRKISRHYTPGWRAVGGNRYDRGREIGDRQAVTQAAGGYHRGGVRGQFTR
jgi:hypothetical protein